MQWALPNIIPHWHTPTFEQKASQQQHLACLSLCCVCLPPPLSLCRLYALEEDAVHLTPPPRLLLAQIIPRQVMLSSLLLI